MELSSQALELDHLDSSWVPSLRFCRTSDELSSLPQLRGSILQTREMVPASGVMLGIKSSHSLTCLQNLVLTYRKGRYISAIIFINISLRLTSFRKLRLLSSFSENQVSFNYLLITFMCINASP